MPLFDPDAVAARSRELEGAPPQAILAWALAEYAPKIAISTAFGVEGCATTHFGIRADYRYFRTVSADESSNIVGISLDEGNFSFSRGTIGAVFRF